MSPEERKEFERVLEKTLEQILPGILDRHAGRRDRFEKQAETYTALEFAVKAEVTPGQVLFWLREGQIIGEKDEDAICGCHKEWRIPHAEWVRFEKHGLYPRYSVASLAKAIHKYDKGFDLETLHKMIEAWCVDGAIRAKKCPHGWRILGSELKKYLEPRGLWVRPKKPQRRPRSNRSKRDSGKDTA